jgi:hypothetical protein
MISICHWTLGIFLMPEVIIAVEEPDNYWSTWQHVFQGPNQTWLNNNQRMTVGNFFIGLQAQTANSWDAQIPPNSSITAATMEYTPFNTNLNPLPFSVTMNTPDRFGLDVQAQDPLHLPFTPFEGWRRDNWSNQEIAVVSTTFTFIAQPIGFDVGNREWAVRFATVPAATLAQSDQLAQRITPVVGNTTVSFISYQMRRFGNPTGNITCHIQGVTIDRGVNIPDGVDITNGTSIPIAASTLVQNPGALSGVIFRFTTNPTLVAGQDYFLVITVEYAADFANFITIGHLNQFLTDGQLFHYGEGLGHDFQNFPGNIDLDFAISNEIIYPFASADVDWPIDTQTVGVTETSPDITDLIQDQVSASGYTIDSGIIINLSRVSDTNQQRFISANAHATQPGAILRVTYGDPIPEGEGKADSYRFHDKLDDQIYREDEDLIMIGQGAVELFNRH